MTTVRDLRKTLRSVNILYETIKAAEKNSREMIMLNQVQLFSGENNKGESFKQYRWKEYAEYKNDKNPLPGLGYPDLKNTGAFYKGFWARINSAGIKMGSTDSKSSWLENHYSKRGKQLIFGLTPENQTTWNTVAFFNDFMKAIMQKTGLRFSRNNGEV